MIRPGSGGAVILALLAAAMAACGSDENVQSACTDGCSKISGTGGGGDADSDSSGGSGAGGSGGCSATCGDADTGVACVDISLSHDSLPAPHLWTSPLLGQWLHLSDKAIIVGSFSFVAVPDPFQPPHYDSGRDWFAMSTFDPIVGQPIRHTLYDPFPAAITQQGSAIYAAGWHDDEFAVGHTYGGPLTPHPLAFGQANVEGISAIRDMPWDGSPRLGAESHVSWDGDEYALHLYSPDPLQFTLYVGRIGSDGQAALPLTKYGVTKNGGEGEFGHKIATDPTSGTTYVFDADYDAMLSGHLRTARRYRVRNRVLGG